MENFSLVCQNLSEVREESRKDKRDSVIFIILIVIMLAVLYCKLFVFETVIVSGDSMQPNLKTGDVLLINKKAEYTYGDIVVCDHDGKWIIKRVIAVEGDTLVTVNKYVYRNDELLSEDYLADYNVGKTDIPKGLIPEGTIPDGYLFVMGDNRIVSLDCRSYGAIPVDEVIGVVTDFSYKIKDSKIMKRYSEYITKHKNKRTLD